MLRSWLNDLGISIEEAAVYVGIVTLLLTLAIALHRLVRRTLARVWRLTAFLTGQIDRKYAKWFVRHNREIYDVYLDEAETLDLGATYVPLALHTGTGPDASNLMATEVIARREKRRIIIIGDPGSGKTTLLQAYGVGILRSTYRDQNLDLAAIAQTREIPFLVPLRRLRPSEESGGIADYIVREVLTNQVGCRDAKSYLRSLLTSGRCVVLLDGLDEVAIARYEAVREEIHRFITSGSKELPTEKARIVLACRRQNFLNFQDHWVPSFTQHVYVLTPFRDNEIVRYLDKRRSSFVYPKTPEEFRKDLTATGNLDLHRTPLILAMSVGLYAKKLDFKIPSSIPKLYDAMISEMLSRRNAKAFPVSLSLKFNARDKRRLLRELAFTSAEATGQFEDFSRADLLTHAMKLAPNLSEVKSGEVEDFVEEVVKYSGLLNDASDDGALCFVHRSIHEYLASEKLAGTPSSSIDFLLEKAKNDHWRQPAIYFASIVQTSVDRFVARLGRKNLELAGHCLSGANVSDRVATPILHLIAKKIRSQPQEVITLLPALLAATRCPRHTVADAATKVAQDLLVQGLPDRRQAAALLGGDVHAVLQILNEVANSSSARIAALAPYLAENIPSDPRLVEPLWRCLDTPGIDQEPSCSDIISRLLTLVMDRSCFLDLQNLPAHPEPVFERRDRQQAYPFRRGASLRSNFVTLLAWADRRSALPTRVNRFYEAKTKDPRAFRRVERAKRWTLRLTIQVGRQFQNTLTIVALMGALAALVAELAIDPDLLLEPFGLGNMLLVAGGAVLAFLILGALSLVPQLRPVERSGAMYELGCYIVLIIPLPSVVLSVALLPVAGISVPLYLATAGCSSYLCFLLRLTKARFMRRTFYIPRLNPYVDIYSDPLSQHWVVRPSGVGGVRRLKRLPHSVRRGAPSSAQGQSSKNMVQLG